jgi:hypothetical protein
LISTSVCGIFIAVQFIAELYHTFVGLRGVKVITYEMLILPCPPLDAELALY